MTDTPSRKLRSHTRRLREEFEGRPYSSQSSGSEREEEEMTPNPDPTPEPKLRCPKFEEFSPQDEEFELYEQRLSAHFLMYGVAEDAAKLPVFICSIGRETYKTLHSLTMPEVPIKMSYKACVALLVGHFKRSSVVGAQKLALSARKQGKSETLAEFEDALRKLATQCGYKSQEEVNGAILEAFVQNVHDPRLRIKLLMDYGKKTFAETISEARTFETVTLLVDADAQSTSQVASGGADNASAVEVNAVRRQDYRKSQDFKGQSNSFDPCYRCGRRHDPDTCNARNYTCHRCGVQGHIQRMCTSKQQSSSGGKYKAAKSVRRKSKCKRVHLTECESGEESHSQSDSEEEVTLNLICHSLDKANKPNPFSVLVGINDVSTYMSVDTCADISVLPYKVYKKFFSDVKLLPYDHELYTYGGTKLVIAGQVKMNVQYKDKVYNNMSLVVVKTDRDQPALFGRDWLACVKLDWSEIFSVLHGVSSEL